MKTKDMVVIATDRICEALTALVRTNYDNAGQTANNLNAAATMLRDAAAVLSEAEALSHRAATNEAEDKRIKETLSMLSKDTAIITWNDLPTPIRVMTDSGKDMGGGPNATIKRRKK